MRIRFGQTTTAMALLAGVFAFAPAASAEMVHMKADLTAKSEVPPNDSKGAGKVDVTYDSASKKVTWTVTFSDLTGPATAAHFHGPAEPGKNAGVAVPIGMAITSPAKGEATLTEAQGADLMAGRMYINIHTATNKGGEIRGQVTK